MSRNRVHTISIYLIAGEPSGDVLGATLMRLVGPPPPENSECKNFQAANIAIARALTQLSATKRYTECIGRIPPDDELVAEVGRRSCAHALTMDQNSWHFQYYRGVARAMASGSRCASAAIVQHSDTARGVADAIMAKRWYEW